MAPRKKAPHEGKHRADEDAPREGQYVPPVFPSSADDRHRDSKPKHEKPPRPRAPRKAAPPKAAPTAHATAPRATAPRAPHPRVAAPRSRRARVDLGDLREEARDFAWRARINPNAKPSVAGRAAAGGAAGAATGAAVGGPVGAAVGGGVGAVGGGIAGARAKREYRRAMHAAPGARRLIVAEFLVCVVIIALSPLTDPKRAENPGKWMRRMTAVMGLFFVLGLMSAAGGGAARFSAGLGGLVTLTLAVSERNLFTKVAGLFGGGGRADPGTRPVGELGDAVGDAASGAIDAGAPP